MIRTIGLMGCATMLFANGVLAQRADDFEWSGRLGSGQVIEVKGVIGDIRAMGSSGDQVEVTAELREHRRGYAEDIEFDVIENDGGVTICAVYPTPRDARRPNECRPGDGGRMNGDVNVESLSGDVEAGTINGDVEISTSGYAQATTVNGSIWAEVGQSDWTGSLEFETVNGSITVVLPEGTGAEVSARTVNGAIETDFPLTVRGRFSSRRLNGTIGDGGRRLWLETVNGSITLRNR